MKIGFWNINRKSSDEILNLVSAFALTNSIDILILFESSLNPAQTLLKLNSKAPIFHYYTSLVSTFVQIFTRFSTSLVRDVADDGRITCKELNSPLGQKVYFVLVHLSSKLYYEGSDQDAMVPEIKKFIDTIETTNNSSNTIVLGDFNMDPFQNGMIQATGFHSTFDKRTARQGKRTIQGKEYKYFYNPMWSFYGELGKGDVHGSYYNAISKPICYFWNIFDQILLRPELLEFFDEDSLKILTSIDGTDLLNKHSRVNNEISDHLPVEFELKNL